MPEYAHPNGSSDCIELDFVEREATSEPLMRLTIHLLATELLISNTVCFFDSYGVQR